MLYVEESLKVAKVTKRRKRTKRHFLLLPEPRPRLRLTGKSDQKWSKLVQKEHKSGPKVVILASFQSLSAQELPLPAALRRGSRRSRINPKSAPFAQLSRK